MIEKSTKFQVLDHGYVIYEDSMGRDEDIVIAARMSTGRRFEGWEPGTICKVCRVRQHEEVDVNAPLCPREWHEWTKTPGDAKLLEHLWSSRHTTPFEMCELKVEVQAPIMVFRQWHRHRTQSYNEMSGRYIELPDLFYLPTADRVRAQSTLNKQGSGDALAPADAEEFLTLMADEQRIVRRNYERALKLGVANELARLDQPVSLYSRMMAKGNLLNWFKFLGLRWDAHAQWEMQEYAGVVAKIIADLWPRSFALFEEYTKHAVTFSRTEMELLLDFIQRERLSIHRAEIIEQLGPKRATTFFNKIGG